MTPTTTGAAELPEAILLRIAGMCEQLAAQISNPAHSEVRDSYLRDAAELRRLHAQVEALSAAQAGVPADEPAKADLRKLQLQGLILALARLALVPPVSPALMHQLERLIDFYSEGGDEKFAQQLVLLKRGILSNGRRSVLVPSSSPAPAQPGQDGERDYPPLPEPDLGMPWRVNAKSDGAAHSSGFTHTQMRAYVDADRAARAAPQPATADAVDAQRWRWIAAHWKTVNFKFDRHTQVLSGLTLTVDATKTGMGAPDIEREIDAAVAAQRKAKP